MRARKKRGAFSLILALLIVLSLELILSLLTWVSPQVYLLLLPSAAHVIPDNQLGHPNPRLPEHDRQGFRNPTVPERTEIVVLGDSQTYGTGVEPPQAWPRQLENLTTRSIYSMAYGGYGPAHSLMLWPEAERLRPDVVVTTLYAGNDLYDAFQLVFRKKRLPALKPADAKLIASVERLEHDGRLQLGQPVSKLSELRRFVSIHSKVFGLMRAVRRALLPYADTRFGTSWEVIENHAQEHGLEIFEDARFRTVFTPKYRHKTLYLEDPRIATGHAVALAVLEQMNQAAVASGKRFLVVLIPTKELVFQEAAQGLSPNYDRLVRVEQKMWQRTREFLSAQDVEYVDTLDALQNQLSRGVQPYFMSRDGHPNKHWHEAIAKAVYRFL